MGTQYETVTINVTGANPQTLTVTVPVDTSSGAGSATFSYTGSNGGTDNIQGSGTFVGKSYTSNGAQVSWQQSNGSIQVSSSVTCYAWGDSPHSGAVAAYLWCNPSDSSALSSGAINRGGSGSATASKTENSLSFDAYNSSGTHYSSPGGTNPVIWSIFNSAGSPVSYAVFPPYTENFNCCIVSEILVPAPGTYTLRFSYKDGSMWGIGNAASGAAPTWSSKGTYRGTSGQTMTVIGGYPLLNSPAMSSGDGGYVNNITQSITFPQAGAYPIELDWDYWFHSGRICHVTSTSGELAPVTLIAAPASSTPSGNLTITPSGGATNLQVTGQPITLTVNISGLSFPTKSYCPVFEGQTGYLNLYNDPTNNVFNFQTYNGQSVDKTSAASAVFSLSSADNTAYQGLFSVGFDGTNFNLKYNGNTANSSNSSRVLSTSLIVTADDIAWFNSSNKSYDVYTPSGTSGGIIYNFEVDYMNKPSVASISPTSVTANGGSNTLSIALNKAFSPQQQGAKNTGNSVNCSCSISGATSTGTPVAVLDSNGWLTGWNVPFTAPSSSTNQTLTVNLTVSGTLTYLSGNTFVTNTVSYISGSVGTITAKGVSFVAPTAYSFSSSPTGPAVSSLVTSMSVSGQVFTAGGNDSVTCRFFYQPSGGSSQLSLGNGVLQSSSQATVGGVSGYLHTFTLTFNPNNYLNTTGDYIGFTATDNVSGLTCTYTSTTAYYIYVSGGGGGGGITY